MQLGPSTGEGTYPEISAELSTRLGLNVDITYKPYLGDTFDQGAQTWTYQRHGDIVVVVDMPRTIFRIRP